MTITNQCTWERNHLFPFRMKKFKPIKIAFILSICIYFLPQKIVYLLQIYIIFEMVPITKWIGLCDFDIGLPYIGTWLYHHEKMCRAHSWSWYDVDLCPQGQIYWVSDMFPCVAHNFFLVCHWLTIFGTCVYHH